MLLIHMDGSWTMGLGISEISGIIKFIHEFITGYRINECESVEKFFNEVIKKSYEDLEKIHNDYTKTLNELANHLKEKELPPPETLIKWFRDQGIEYRSDREKLWTIEVEMYEHDFNQLKTYKNHEGMITSIKEYISAVLQYQKTTAELREISFYRDYEQHLSGHLAGIDYDWDSAKGKNLFSSLGDVNNMNEVDCDRVSERVKKLFYSPDFVTDMNEMIIRHIDKGLPDQWKNVTGKFRRVRSVLKQ